jgi:hypothetical protein
MPPARRDASRQKPLDNHHGPLLFKTHKGKRFSFSIAGVLKFLLKKARLRMRLDEKDKN